ncbi:M56 family metallopeptidase, partial [Streptomyces sp. YIM B13518]|uniref:M56 family metallopeptidase n=1 Tax=Streptomyces sp. YIM B13518 TaxID=3366316 RepID=UPI00367AF064
MRADLPAERARSGSLLAARTAMTTMRMTASSLSPNMGAMLLLRGTGGPDGIYITVEMGGVACEGRGRPHDVCPATAVPFDEVVGKAAIPALCAVLVACGRSLWRHGRVRRGAHRALAGLRETEVVVLPDGAPYAYALPGGRRDRVVVTTAMLDCLEPAERRALFAHERAHLTARHHRFLLAVQLAARANPFLRPLRTAVAYTAERWADEDAARAVGSRRTVARAIGKAALVSRGTPVATLAGLAAAGPVPRR